MVPYSYHRSGHCLGVSADNSVNRIEHDILRQLIAEWRTGAGLSQRELSARLQKSHNYIVKIEKGARGVEVVELVDIARALGLTLETVFNEYRERLDS